MKFSNTCLVTSSLLLFMSQPGFAQPVRMPEYSQNAELHIHTGWTPYDVETLVDSPDIIIKGRFGRLLSHELWWGYSDTRESIMERLGDDAHLVDRVGLPSSLYEIVIDEVLVGNVEGGTVVYRLLESDPGDRRYTNESDEKLFFLTLNPDGTYGSRGVAYILTNRNGVYGYEYPSDSVSRGTDTGTFAFAPSMVADEFEAYIKSEIQKIRPSN